jgi:hypothetical protein
MHTLKQISLTHIFVVVIFLAASVQTAQAGVIYVNRIATGNNDGTSWEDAYNDLQDALARPPVSGDEIWVAAATVCYNCGSDYYSTFQLVDGVDLYGGFPNTGNPTWQDRDWENNATCLGGSGTAAFIVTATNVGQSTIDGFQILHGEHGIYCDHSSLTISNNQISDVTSGIWVWGASPVITDCLISATSSHLPGYHSAGITVWSDTDSTPMIISAPLISNNRIHSTKQAIRCEESTQAQITNNHITGWLECGIYCWYAPATSIKNNWIYGSHNGNPDYTWWYRHAAGIYVVNCSLSLRNNTIVDNDHAVRAISEGSNNIALTSSIVWANTEGPFLEHLSATCTAAYSCIQGSTVYPGEGNINDDPQFVNPASDDYHLTCESPCIEKGDPDLQPAPNETDIDGEDRIIDGDGDTIPVVDMGADEIHTMWPTCWNCPTQCHGDSDCDGEVKGSDFLAMRDSWYECYGDPNYNPCADFDRDGCVTGSDFLILDTYWYTSPDPNCDCGGTWPPE